MLRWSFWFVASMALTTGLAWLMPQQARATSCAAPDFARSTSNADVIFVGTAGAERSAGGLSTFLFQVERVHKGVVPLHVEVQGGGMKGAWFIQGGQYLVFGTLRDAGDGKPPALQAHLCGGTQPTAQAAGWLLALGASKPPAAAGSALRSGKT